MIFRELSIFSKQILWSSSSEQWSKNCGCRGWKHTPQRFWFVQKFGQNFKRFAKKIRDF